jgi:hypothetical protein
MYRRRGSVGSGLVRVARSDRCCLRDSKVAACSGPQTKSFVPRNVFSNGRLEREMCPRAISKYFGD